MKKTLLSVLALAFVAACTAKSQFAAGADPQGEIIKAKGNKVIEALNSYKSKSGSYPSSLDALVPTYLATHDDLTYPQTALGNKDPLNFGYDTNTAGGYDLRFSAGTTGETPSFPYACTASDKSQGWNCYFN